MPFAEVEIARIDRTVGAFCRHKSPEHLRDKVRVEYRISGHEVLIYEKRPAWDNPREWMEGGIAKLRFVRTAGEWRLYWQRASLKWQSYEPLPSSQNVAELVTVIEEDPHHCFFG